MYELISVLTIDIIIFISFISIILKMIGKSYIDISNCRERYFDSLDRAFEYDNDGYDQESKNFTSDADNLEDSFHSNYSSEINNETDRFNNNIIYTEDVIFSKYIEVSQYFAIEKYREILIDILSGDTILTTGFIEDLLNNEDFEYPKENGDIIEIFNINTEYNKLLNKFGYYYFNYNSKINVINIGSRDNITYYSSVGELNFYKWFIENVYDYVIAKYK